MATGKAGADAHCRDLQCQRRGRAQELRHDEEEDVRLLELQRLVHEPDHPVRLRACQPPPQRRRVPLLVEDIPVLDHRHDQVVQCQNTLSPSV